LITFFFLLIFLFLLLIINPHSTLLWIWCHLPQGPFNPCVIAVGPCENDCIRIPNERWEQEGVSMKRYVYVMIHDECQHVVGMFSYQKWTVL
jgi:hypothetical protein